MSFIPTDVQYKSHIHSDTCMQDDMFTEACTHGSDRLQRLLFSCYKVDMKISVVLLAASPQDAEDGANLQGSI